MAEIDRRFMGKQFEKGLAGWAPVQGWLDGFIFEAQVRAEEDLAEHRQEGHAFIEAESGRIDRYLILNDMRGQKAAMSIEYGRRAATYQVTNPDTGEQEIVRLAAMDGLYILHKAMRARKRRRPAVKIPNTEFRRGGKIYRRIG